MYTETANGDTGYPGLGYSASEAGARLVQTRQGAQGLGGRGGEGHGSAQCALLARGLAIGQNNGILVS